MVRVDDENAINDIRTLSLDMINEAGSGHPGICLGASPIVYSIYKEHLKYNYDNPTWFNRDRFVLSAGHGSAMLYSTLFMCGHKYTIDDLKKFRSLDSITPGHPEYNPSLGIEMTTGPLGQGIATAVGMAIAEKYLAATFNEEKNEVIDYKIYTLCGDGDLMEGISSEACSLAGTLKLNNLIVLYDSNKVSLDGSTDLTFTENVTLRFESYDWDIIEVKEKEGYKGINKAINIAKKSKDRPTLIIVSTTIGKYSKNENTASVHGSPLEFSDYLNIKDTIGYSMDKFTYDEENANNLRSYIKERTTKEYTKWANIYNNYKNTTSKEKLENLEAIISNQGLKVRLERIIDYDNIDHKLSMRDLNSIIMNEIGNILPEFIGGSADVVSSTKTYLKDKGNFGGDNYLGRNIYFGVREHAMGAIMNGLAISNLRPFGSAFLIFSDYLKPSLRLSAMMDLKTTYIFTHDSINVGYDGPTHEPIEQLNSLRLIPNFTVYRPADMNELIGSWNNILESDKPCALVLSRNANEINTKTSIVDVKKGGYIVSDYTIKMDLIIIATGSELSLALKVKERLAYERIDIRVVSVPNLNIFLSDEEYLKMILPDNVKKVVIEYSDGSLWKGITETKNIFSLKEFGKSGNPEDVIKHYLLDIDSICEKIRDLL